MIIDDIDTERILNWTFKEIAQWFNSQLKPEFIDKTDIEVVYNKFSNKTEVYALYSLLGFRDKNGVLYIDRENIITRHYATKEQIKQCPVLGNFFIFPYEQKKK
jgi:hypothetical protein